MLTAVLAACGADPTPTPLPTATPTATPAPRATATAVVAATPTPSPTATRVPATPTATPRPYYEGKTIRLVTGWTAGSSSDLQARLIGIHLPKFIPGNPRIEVTNIPAGQSIAGVNFVYKADPDGLTMYYGVGAQPSSQLTGEGVEFDFAKVIRVALWEPRFSVWVVHKDAPYKRIQAAIGGTTTFTHAGTPGDASVELLNKLNLPWRMISGIPGDFATATLALDRKDVLSINNSSGWYQWPVTRPGWFRDGYVVPFAIDAHPDIKIGPNAEIPLPADVKNLVDVMPPDLAKAWLLLKTNDFLYRPAFFPPGTPPAIWRVVEKAFADAMKDPQFLADLSKIMGRTMTTADLVSADKMDALVRAFPIRELDALYVQYQRGYKTKY